MKPAPSSQMRFRDELKDFFYFLRHPRSARRLPGRVQGDGWYLDWFAPLPWKRLLQWAGMLWLMCPKQGIVIVYYVQTKPKNKKKIFIRRGLFCTMRCDILAITFGCFYVIFIV